MKSVDKVQLMKTLFIFGTIEYRKKVKLVKQYGEIHVQETIKQKLVGQIS